MAQTHFLVVPNLIFLVLGVQYSVCYAWLIFRTDEAGQPAAINMVGEIRVNPLSDISNLNTNTFLTNSYVVNLNPFLHMGPQSSSRDGLPIIHATRG